MLEIILVAVAGSVIAGLWDLKTTEVPDEIPYIMVALGLSYWFVTSTMEGNFYPFIVSLLVGTAVLLIGVFLFKRGKWGGADAWILAAIAYMIPLWNGRVFIIDYIFNMLLVSVAYMVIYAVFIGFRTPKMMRMFSRDIWEHKKIVLALIVIYIAFFAVLTLSFLEIAYLLFPTFLSGFVFLVFLVFFWRYAKVIENRVFTKKIPVSKLRPGDVLMDSNWVGLTPEQVQKIKKQKKYVVIKEGIRFVPVFPISLVITLLYGNLLVWLML